MATNNSLATRAAGSVMKKQSFSTYLTSDGVRKKVNEMVGGKNGDRFIAAVISAVSTNPALAACDHSTILSAAMLGEALRLSPSPQLGQYYMVPYEDNKNGRTVATFQLGYKGYVQLAIRSGYYKNLNVQAIKEGELIKYDPLNEEFEADIIQDAEAREAAETIGYFAMLEYLNGFRKVLYWPKAKMEAHAQQYSKGYTADIRKGTKYTFWSKDFDGMALKTMLRQLISKWGIMSIEMQQALETDMSFPDTAGGRNYVDDGAADADGSLITVEHVEQAEESTGLTDALPDPEPGADEPDWMNN